MTFHTVKDLAYLVFILACLYCGGKFFRWLGRNDTHHWRQHISDENSSFLSHPSHNARITRFRAQHRKRTEDDGIRYKYGFDKKGRPTRKFDNTAYKEQFKHLKTEE
jgi:YD repeat-containing protein